MIFSIPATNCIIHLAYVLDDSCIYYVPTNSLTGRRFEKKAVSDTIITMEAMVRKKKTTTSSVAICMVCRCRDIDYLINIHREPQKRATLFLTITLAFLSRFLYFFHQWKQEGILYTRKLTKFTTSP